MKKKISVMILVSVSLITSFVSVKAQESVIFGLKSGVGLSSLNGNIKVKQKLNYQIGFTTDLALTDNLYVITGMDLQKKGIYSKKGTSLPEMKYNPVYLQLPLHVAYKLNIGLKNKFVTEAGPYLAYGISKKMRNSEKDSSPFGNNGFKRLDYGIGVGLGFEFDKFIIKGCYDIGMINISRMKDVSAKSRNAYLTLGIHF
jgi:hypothetical protein